MDRLSGTDRYKTNRRYQASITDESLDYVVIAPRTNYPDTLAGGVLNKRLNGTTLLVTPQEGIIK
ncbi:cell wall-binding repeat-containing protein [Salipaludibacillus sp. CF4.18]|uniref:cell wall-binding repeat-containing protein n=1 Tax=Salipaludibacillus sp. CF4.18 TaxID=3373081 RepID=UPI003EE51300